MPDDFAEETFNPNYADDRGFFKVELWTQDGLQVERMLHAGNRIEKARQIFDDAVRRRPGRRYMIRQGTSVLRKWPDDSQSAEKPIK
jgi:hypothetical protein